jgi:hypothetical protein
VREGGALRAGGEGCDGDQACDGARGAGRCDPDQDSPGPLGRRCGAVLGARCDRNGWLLPPGSVRDPARPGGIRRTPSFQPGETIFALRSLAFCREAATALGFAGTCCLGTALAGMRARAGEGPAHPGDPLGGMYRCECAPMRCAWR